MNTQTNPLELKAWRPNCWVTVKGIVCNEQHVEDVLPLKVFKATALTTDAIRRITNTRDRMNGSPWMYGFWITPVGTLIDADGADCVAGLSMRRCVAHTMRAIHKMMKS